MASPLKKTIKKIHLWLGIASGLVIFIVAITGSIYVFSEDIKAFTHKDRRIIEVPQNAKRLPIGSILQVAEDAINHRCTYSNIVIPNFSDHTVSVMFIERNDKAFGYSNYISFFKTIYINPYTGEVVKIENSKWEFFNIIFNIHVNLFMGYNKISHIIVAGATWIFVIMLISGLVLWWPKKKQRKQSFRFSWKITTRWRRKNLDIHRILGFYFFIIALISALTGLLWASQSFNKTVKWVANGGKVIEQKALPESRTKIKSVTPLDDILAKTLTKIPESKYVLIRKHPNDKIPYIVRSYVSEMFNYKRIEMYYDRNTAELLAEVKFADKNNGEKIQALNYDIHVGTIGGWPTKILTFFMSLVVASLPITGFMIWYGRKNKSKKR